jgi:hypothetical protein
MFSVAEAPVSVFQVGPNSLLPLVVACVVSIGDRKFLENTKLRFDQIQPGSLGWRPYGVNVQPLKQGQKLGVVVHVVEIVQHDKELAAWIAVAEALEGVAHLSQATTGSEDPVEVVGVHVVEGQEMFDAVRAMVSGSHANRPALFCPRQTAHRPDL